ncbi:MAG TPA: hypothetical protein VK074_02515 [Fodinibius sp.]|nr:hypothetical protein [Fodinibius sp.]
MSIVKGLIVKPRPCPFCGGELLELRSVMFRQWNIHCLNTDCRCKGPDGQTTDRAVVKWNSLMEGCISQRQKVSQLGKDYKNPIIIKKIWKGVRTLGAFKAKEIIRITECHQETVMKYLSLLEANDYLRIESKNSSNTTPNTYRCIKPRTVKAPSWLDLQLSPREYQVYKSERKSLEWSKVQAATD